MYDLNTPAGRAMRRICEYLLVELQNGFHEVVLIPAPEPAHSEHRIRVAQSQNCRWYREFSAQFTNCRGIGKKQMKRPRTYIRRDKTERTLQRMIAGNFRGVQAARLIEFIDLFRRNHRNKRRPLAETYYFDGGIWF